MPENKYNKLKKQILELLLNANGLTSHDLQIKIDARITNVCDCLLRLHQQGLVTRNPIISGHLGRPQFTYAINQRGKDRLSYWATLAKVNSNPGVKN